MNKLGNDTYTCVMTQKANTFGGAQDEEFRDVVLDTAGNMYVIGVTSSTSLIASGGQDIALFKMSPDMAFTSLKGWGIVWGASLEEEATGIVLDDTEKYLFVSGYSNTEGYLSLAKYDMLVMKVLAASGQIQWVKRFGGTGNDKANGIDCMGSYVYVVGEADSPGWTSSPDKSDMVLLKLDMNSGSVQYGKYLGGIRED